ncbi:MAG: MoaD/ThiS family protein [Deltaproteobacteria bacterium]|nr:MoaD/ThiS family protein [Deltaproteobacteria bacterium]
MAKVRIPTPLRKFTGGADEVAAGGATVGQVVADMDSRFPGIKERLCEANGRVRRFVNIYVNGDDIRFLQNLDTAIQDGDEVSIVPAIAGGAVVGG